MRVFSRGDSSCASVASFSDIYYMFEFCRNRSRQRKNARRKRDWVLPKLIVIRCRSPPEYPKNLGQLCIPYPGLHPLFTAIFRISSWGHGYIFRRLAFSSSVCSPHSVQHNGARCCGIEMSIRMSLRFWKRLTYICICKAFEGRTEIHAPDNRLVAKTNEITLYSTFSLKRFAHPAFPGGSS